MEAKSFIKLLRKVIREEVQHVVRKEFRALLTEQKINHKQVIDHGLKLSEISNNPKPKRKFSKNTMLNGILNETAASPPSQEMTDWGTMNFKSEMAESYGTQAQSNTQMMPLAASGINGEPVNMNNESTAAVVNAMTKDYSALMKAIDKKKGK